MWFYLLLTIYTKKTPIWQIKSSRIQIFAINIVCNLFLGDIAEFIAAEDVEMKMIHRLAGVTAGVKNNSIARKVCFFGYISRFNDHLAH